MAKRDKSRTAQRGFVVMEATGANGGFPAYMNQIMADMEFEMAENGFTGPYKFEFSGGDGYASPVFLTCSVA